MPARKRNRPRSSQKQSSLEYTAPDEATRQERENAQRKRHSSLLRHELLLDIEPLLEGIKTPINLSDPASDTLLHVIFNSESMADEPELESIFFEPLDCEDTYHEESQKMGIDPQTFDTLSEDKILNLRLDLSYRCIEQLLSEKMRYEILDGIDALRLRLKTLGKKNEAMKVAAVQFFLSNKKVQQIWPMIGLVQAIYHRSLEIGFNFVETFIEMNKVSETREGGTSFQTVTEKSSTIKKYEKILSKHPSMTPFLEKRADKIWNEGNEALIAGHLYLGLFSENELLEAGLIAGRAFGFDPDKKNNDPDILPKETPEDFQQKFILGLRDYITKLMTPKRLDQAKNRIDLLLKDESYKNEWSVFILMCSTLIKPQKLRDELILVLINAIIGEFKNAIRKPENRKRH